MNDGYLTVMVVIIISILLMTGWKQQIADDIQLRTLLLLTIASIICVPLTIDCGYFLLQGSVLPCLLWVVYRLLRNRPPLHAFYSLGSVLLLLSVWVWMKRMYTVDPVFVLINGEWDASLTAGIFAAILSRRMGDQQILLFLTLIAGQAFLFSVGHSGSGMVGGWDFWDNLAIALIVARLAHGFMQTFLLIRRTSLRRKSFRQEENPES